MRMNIVPPGGNFAMEVRYAIDDRHRKGSLPPHAPAARPSACEQNRATSRGQGRNGRDRPHARLR